MPTKVGVKGAVPVGPVLAVGMPGVTEAGGVIVSLPERLPLPLSIPAPPEGEAMEETLIVALGEAVPMPPPSPPALTLARDVLVAAKKPVSVGAAGEALAESVTEEVEELVGADFPSRLAEEAGERVTLGEGVMVARMGVEVPPPLMASPPPLEIEGIRVGEGEEAGERMGEEDGVEDVEKVSGEEPEAEALGVAVGALGDDVAVPLPGGPVGVIVAEGVGGRGVAVAPPKALPREKDAMAVAVGVAGALAEEEC